jgi:hypothetical protein
MKARTSALTLVLCFVAGAMCFASDLQMGTWKLNEAKTKLAPGVPKNNTVVYEAAGDNVKGNSGDRLLNSRLYKNKHGPYVRELSSLSPEIGHRSM